MSLVCLLLFFYLQHPFAQTLKTLMAQPPVNAPQSHRQGAECAPEGFRVKVYSGGGRLLSFQEHDTLCLFTTFWAQHTEQRSHSSEGCQHKVLSSDCWFWNQEGNTTSFCFQSRTSFQVLVKWTGRMLKRLKTRHAHRN